MTRHESEGVYEEKGDGLLDKNFFDNLADIDESGIGPEWQKFADPYWESAWNKVEKYVDRVCKIPEKGRSIEEVKGSFPSFIAAAMYTRQLGPKLYIIASMLGKQPSFEKLLKEFDSPKSVCTEHQQPLFVTPEDRGKAAGFVEKYIETVFAHLNRTSTRDTKAITYLRDNKARYIKSISILGQQVA